MQNRIRQTLSIHYALPRPDPQILLETPHPQLRQTLTPYANPLREAYAALQTHADTLRRNPPPPVLCHTDVHGWNLMWDGHLTLIDWEGLRRRLEDITDFANSLQTDPLTPTETTRTLHYLQKELTALTKSP